MSKKTRNECQKKEVKVYFNGDKVSDKSRIFKIIKKHLKKAKDEIIVSVAWLTNEKIIKTLCKQSKKGIKIKVLISDEKSNYKNNGVKTDTIKLAKYKNIKLYLWDSYDENVKPYKVKMHHKFCVIDNKILITGSFNWSEGATYNEENIIVIKEQLVIDKYINEFTKLVGSSSAKRIKDESIFDETMEKLFQE